MRTDSSLIYIVVAITALHFLVGIGYLLYKLGRPSKSQKEESEETD
ncbi:MULTISPECIES: hypothetical protein [Marinifilum]|jgi:hypothetical protein|nr:MULTISPECIES: hypothetical protein [Marinifilum]MCY1632858.1 hypothetical protein [Marinifilum sp. D737]